MPGLDTEEKGYNGEAQAYDNYQALLREYPDYPDKLLIYQKLLALARKLSKNDDAINYENQIRLLTLVAK